MFGFETRSLSESSPIALDCLASEPQNPPGQHWVIDTRFCAHLCVSSADLNPGPRAWEADFIHGAILQPQETHLQYLVSNSCIFFKTVYSFILPSIHSFGYFEGQLGSTCSKDNLQQSASTMCPWEPTQVSGLQQAPLSTEPFISPEILS